MEEPEIRFVPVKTDADGNIIEEATKEEVHDAIRKASNEKPARKEKELKPLPNKNAVKKKSRGKRLKEAIFGEDIQNVPEYVLYDVLIPALKKLFVDSVNNALGMALFGEVRGRRREGQSHVSMSSVYEGRSEGRFGSGRSARARNKVNDIIFDTRNDAEYVLDQLIDLVDEYGSASLQDLYYIIGTDSAHTDANWGWTNLRGAAVVAVAEGYILDMPPIKALV